MVVAIAATATVTEPTEARRQRRLRHRGRDPGSEEKAGMWAVPSQKRDRQLLGAARPGAADLHLSRLRGASPAL